MHCRGSVSGLYVLHSGILRIFSEYHSGDLPADSLFRLKETLMSFRRWIAATSGVLVVVAVSAAMRVADTPASQMQVFAKTWLDSLDEAQKAKALLPYDSKDRTTWNFVPMPTRKGCH